MRPSIKLGKIGGVPIGAHWSVLGVVALLAYGLYAAMLPAAAPGVSDGVYALVAVALAILFLACLLGHELAHALVARHFGIGVRGITLWLLGGVSELEKQAPTARAELFIAGAGPLSSLAFGVLSGGLAAILHGVGGPKILVIALIWLAGVNLILGVFNLLPGAPLDGGRVLKAILWWLRGDRDAAQVTADRAGVALGLVLAAGGFAEVLFASDFSGLWLVLLGWFLVSAATAESANTRMVNALGGRRVGDVMSVPAVCGNDWQTVEGFATQVAAGCHYRAFPVVDFDGRLTGVVSLSRLAQVPPGERQSVRLRDVATPAERLHTVDVGASMPEVLPTLPQSQALTPVTSGGRVVGVLTMGDIARAIELATLTSAVMPPPVGVARG